MRGEMVKFLTEETPSVTFWEAAALLLKFLKHSVDFDTALNLTG